MADAHADQVGNVRTPISNTFNANIFSNGFFVAGICNIICVLRISLNCILYTIPYDVMHLSNVEPV